MIIDGVAPQQITIMRYRDYRASGVPDSWFERNQPLGFGQALVRACTGEIYGLDEESIRSSVAGSNAALAARMAACLTLSAATLRLAVGRRIAKRRAEVWGR